MDIPADLHGIIIYPASWAKSVRDRWNTVNNINAREDAARGIQPGPQQLEMSQELGGTIFSSPNDRPYPLRHNRAASKLFSQRQREFALVGDNAARRHVGISPEEQHNAFTHYHGIGSWENSVEPAMATMFHKPVTGLQLQKIGADVGTWARQHGILVFSPHPEGTEQLMHFRARTHSPMQELDPHTVSRISRMVTGEFNKYFDPGEKPEYWMPGRTILPDTTGHTDVLVWVPPWESKPSRLHEAFSKIAERMEGDRPRYWPGMGLLLGGSSPYSDEGYKAFDDKQKREVAIANYRRALEAKESQLVDPRRVEPQRLAADTDRPAGMITKRPWAPATWKNRWGDVPWARKPKDTIEQPVSTSAKGPGSPFHPEFIGLGTARSDIRSTPPQSASSTPSSSEYESSVPATSSGDEEVRNPAGYGYVTFNSLPTYRIHPDALYRGDYGYPEETFARDPEGEVHRHSGDATHYMILDNLRGWEYDPNLSESEQDIPESGRTDLPPGRMEALHQGWVLGRTGDVLGRRVTSFWNNPIDEHLVKQHVADEIANGMMHPHSDWISFSGNDRLVRAGDFVRQGTPAPEQQKQGFTKEQLAQAHVNPLLKALIIAREAKSKKRQMQVASEQAGLVRPGQKYWAPMSESRHGDPIRLADKTQMTNKHFILPPTNTANPWEWKLAPHTDPDLKTFVHPSDAGAGSNPFHPEFIGPGTARTDIGIKAKPIAPPPASSQSSSSESTPQSSSASSYESHIPSGSDVDSNYNFKRLLTGNAFLDPDDLYASYHGQPEETFAAENPHTVYTSYGGDTHADILENAAYERGSDNPTPMSRNRAVDAGWVLGRTGDVYGQRVTAFWNPRGHEDKVKAYVAEQVRNGNLDPDSDWISFTGLRRMVRAGDFVGLTPEEERSTREISPEDLAKAHINPAFKKLKELILGAAQRSKKKPMQVASEQAGLISPGQKYWAPMSEQRHGDPIRAGSVREPAKPIQPRSPSKVGVVIRGVYYPPGKFFPRIIQAIKDRQKAKV